MSAMEEQSATTPRLVRRRQGRMIAGVCTGIADHFGIDPILVRIAFVVAAFFGGAGVIAYVAACILIPEEYESTSIGERVVREHRWGRIAGLALIVIALSSLARPVWWFGGHGLFPVLLIVGGLFLLSHEFSARSGASPAPLASPIPPAPPGPPTTEALPSPPPVEPPPRQERKRRGGLGALTFGLLMIGGGVVGLVLAAGNSIEPSYVFAIGLLIVGGALVVSTWFGRGLVLVPAGLVLVGLMSASTVIDVPITGGFGEKKVTPLTLAELKDEYHLGIGELRLDLTHVAFDRGSTRTVKVTVGVGHLVIVLPRNIMAELRGHAGLGEVRFLDQHEGGIRVDRDMTLSAPGENAAHVVIEADVGVGQVEALDAAA
jgi:phage shock protein PspC (stress-responsive transcriptional regulator)